ncbi:hypothetical protein I5X65_004525 [Salmonella enterica]|nr:hypothetical protein [Salmonella enterica]EDX2043811.1 hypothetical protein [Salmonella enterica subsp. houtenae serovar 50:z4,z23:-]EFR3648716.1 hypothetical protein [Salmonella enterica]EGC8747843.1 hypothetical protein [Salmonella enterica]EGJ1113643.1 hypothetical protein [Salmonella enterica]
MWLAIQAASQKWTMPLKDWHMAMSRFIIEFGDLFVAARNRNPSGSQSGHISAHINCK